MREEQNQLIEMLATAYHEAGHAFMVLKTPQFKLLFQGINLIPTNKNDLANTRISRKNKSIYKTLKKLLVLKFKKAIDLENERLLSELRISLAGKIAERILFGTTKISDYDDASSDVKDIIDLLNMLDFTEKNQIRTKLSQETKMVTKLIIENYKIIHLIAVTCLIKPKNNKKEIKFVKEFQKLPQHIENELNRNPDIKNLLNRTFNFEDFSNYETFNFEDFFSYEIINNSELSSLYDKNEITSIQPQFDEFYYDALNNADWITEKENQESSNELYYDAQDEINDLSNLAESNQ